jgi:PTS system ascorbate-specific IIC component
MVNPIVAWVSQVLNVEGVHPFWWMIFATGMADWGSYVALATLFGFLLNLVLARLTPIKTVHITGHLMVAWAAGYTCGAAGNGFSGTSLLLIASVATGIHFWLDTYLSYLGMKGNEYLTDEWCMGSLDGTGLFLTKYIGPLLGSNKNRLADMEFPESLEWLRDSQIAVGFFSSFLFIIFGLLVGEAAVIPFAGGLNWIIYIVLAGTTFSAYLSILLYGVRVLITELVPAFAGFSEKLVPGAIPGLDYPTVFQFSTTGMFMGYLSNLAGGIAATVVMAMVPGITPVVLTPSIFMNFWSGAMEGVFWDAWGGRNAVFIGGFLYGFIFPFLWAYGYPLSGTVVQGIPTAFDTSTGAFFMIPYYLICKMLAPVFGTGAPLF